MTKFIENRKRVRQFEKPIVVFYHANCTDGFTAAWVAWKKFGDKAEYISSYHETEPPSVSGKRVFTIDLTFPEPVTRRLIEESISVTSIDHHISTKEATLLTNDPLFDLNHSGSTLAWQYFFKEAKIPRFLLSVEDMDLWRKKLPGSPALYAFLDLYDFNFKIWSQLIEDYESDAKRKKMLATGNLLLKYEGKMIERHINRNAKLVEFEGYEVYAINETTFVSQVGGDLATAKPPFAIVWSENKDSHVLVSLRGTGQVDLSEIAKKHGGGGHKNSAAFRLSSLADIPWRPI